MNAPANLPDNVATQVTGRQSTGRPMAIVMSKSAGWNIGIQILRGIAAMLVVCHHSLEESLAISTRVAPEWLIALGACGVDIFFVISGFIIYSVTYGRDPGNPESAPAFLLKRFTRIFPLYWICLFAVLALWSSGLFYRSLHLDAHILGASFFLLPSSKLIIGVAWTLVFEMYFYYLFSITLYLRSARISVLATSAMICAGLLLSNLLPPGNLKHFLSNPIALEFCFGLMLSYLIHQRVLDGIWLRFLWLPGLILMVVAAVFVKNSYGSTAGPGSNIRFLVWGLPALLVTASFIKMQVGKSILNRILVPVGDASYSIYLTHPMLMILFAFLIKHHVLKPIAYPGILPFLFVVISAAFGLAVHLSVERPVLAWLRGRLATPNQWRKFAVAFRGFVGISPK
jgi:exopolysaccharide production protein ExoZ